MRLEDWAHSTSGDTAHVIACVWQRYGYPVDNSVVHLHAVTLASYPLREVKKLVPDHKRRKQQEPVSKPGLSDTRDQMLNR